MSPRCVTLFMSFCTSLFLVLLLAACDTGAGPTPSNLREDSTGVSGDSVDPSPADSQDTGEPDQKEDPDTIGGTPR